jgi:methionyl-tRNA synthetase
MAADLPLPRRVIGHGWWLMNEAKMSKSLGNVVRPQGYVERFGVDALRYFVMREMVLGQDANFTDDVFLTRYNADLANDLGNVVSRVTTMIQRYCGGRIPDRPKGPVQGPDAELEAKVSGAINRAIDAATQYDFSQSLRETWELISALNKFIVLREPWALAKAPESRPVLEATLYNTADALRVVAALVDPVMPGTAERIRTMLGTAPESWVGLKAGTLTPGLVLGRIDPLFPRMEHSVEELRAMASNEAGSGQPAAQAPAVSQATTPAGAPGAAPAPAATGSDRISIDDFMKIDLRVAKVLTAEKVPNSRKLVKMTIDVGAEQRTLVAGIAEAYEPEQLVGRTIVMVFNLKPAKLMGIESNGMVLAASPDGGKPTLVGFDQDVAPGTRVR